MAAVVAAVVGCYGPSTLIPVLDGENPLDIPPEWERYGAYYIIDDMIISSVMNPLSGIAATTYTIFKKMKVLNADGSKYGTIIIQRYTPVLQSFDVKIYDAQGNSVPVDKGRLRAKYMETGKVVVPAVSAGSTIAVTCMFIADRPPAAIERWFTESIPVYEGRLVVHTDGQLRFSYDKNVRYGMRSQVLTSSTEAYGGTAFIWTVNNLPPSDSTPFCRPVSESEPRAVLRISPMYDENGGQIDNWKGVAGLLKKVNIDPALFESSDSVSYKVAEITKNINSERRQAEAIVSWVQRNISCYLQPVKATIAQSLAEGKSDMVLAALLCREMLHTVGIEAELVLTRARTRGGFDPSFLSFHSCVEGMLILRLGGVPYAVSPLFSEYPIGAYPPEYFGNCGLNIDRGDTMRLPPPLWGSFIRGSHAMLDVRSDTAEQTIRLRFEELSTYHLRSALRIQGKADQRALVERMLQQRGDRNALVTFTVEGLDNLDKPLEIIVRFRNNHPPAELPGMVRYDLSSYFADPFPAIDSARREEIVVSVPILLRDTVEIRKVAGRTATLEADSWQTSNELFDARFFRNETDKSFLIIREATLHPCSISRSEIPAIVGAISEMNRAGHAAVSLSTASTNSVRALNGLRPK